MNPVFFLMGATASGKTDLAAALSEHLPIELISVDAAQVYRHMNIGTAKPDTDFLTRYPHHLINIREPYDDYSAADFCTDATLLIEQIHERGRFPLLVGGTMFYFSALEKGLSPLPSTDEKTRLQAKHTIDEKGLDWLYQTLMKMDPIFTTKLNVGDRQRLQRGYEMFLMTGMSPSQVIAASNREGLPYKIIKLGLFHTHRQYLHELIAMRFEKMLKQGLVEETEKLLSLGMQRDSVAGRIVGYRQTIDYLDGKDDFDNMKQKGIAATRQLAKRQLTWMRNQSGLIWLPLFPRKTMQNQLLLSLQEMLKQCF